MECLLRSRTLIEDNGAPSMRTHLAGHGHVVAFCDYCPTTTEFVGPRQAEETVKPQGWTVRRGDTRCGAFSELAERQDVLTEPNRSGSSLVLECGIDIRYH